MNARFADTAFYVAVVNVRDQLHELARGLLASYTGPVVTTEFVLAEAANFFLPSACSGGIR